jgi:hypothetical protein
MPANEPLRCKQCGGVAEEARRCYATPVCFACLPPPAPLPVAKLRSAKACAPPTHHAFDIDIYDCPCGHMYGDHDYSWLSTAVHPEKAMLIVRCEKCGSVPNG